MRVFVTGGTGLIGRQLVRRLAERGDHPVILSRQSNDVRRDPSMRSYQFVPGDPTAPGPWELALDGCDAVVNLAGQNLFAKRWNAAIKRTIRDSRVYSTENIVAAIGKARDRPKVLVQASAIGYYGPHRDEEHTEDSPSGTDFLAVICREWEEASHGAEAYGARVAQIRTGVVLAKGQGALGVMTPIFKLGPGTPVGSGGGLLKPATGQQWMSWIHIDDIVGIYLMTLDNPEARGPINGTAPNPVRNAEFSRTLSKVLWKPYAPWRISLPFGPPDVMLQLLLGEVAQVVTKGQKVLPRKAQALGYSFHYPRLADALRAIFTEPKDSPHPAPTRVASGAHH